MTEVSDKQNMRSVFSAIAKRLGHTEDDLDRVEEGLFNYYSLCLKEVNNKGKRGYFTKNKIEKMLLNLMGNFNHAELTSKRGGIRAYLTDRGRNFYERLNAEGHYKRVGTLESLS